MEKEELMEKAIGAMELSYSPYSNFKVGAAALMDDGEIFLGANIENASYSCTMCAERNAIYNAYMHGYTQENFVALAIVTDTERPASPCGTCRQVISELVSNDCKIYLGNLKGNIKETNVEELLPFAFEEFDLSL